MENIYTPPSRELSRKREELTPDAEKAFREFSQRVFAEGALPSKVKQLIAGAAFAHSVIALDTMNQTPHSP